MYDDQRRRAMRAALIGWAIAKPNVHCIRPFSSLHIDLCMLWSIVWLFNELVMIDAYPHECSCRKFRRLLLSIARALYSFLTRLRGHTHSQMHIRWFSSIYAVSDQCVIIIVWLYNWRVFTGRNHMLNGSAYMHVSMIGWIYADFCVNIMEDECSIRWPN